MVQYRVTKYDPELRDDAGRYLRDEWTCVGDVGQAFGGVVLTREEYQRVEDAYVTTALAFLREAGCESLTTTGLENHSCCPFVPAEGAVLAESQLGDVVRQVLRAEFWCRLEGGSCFLHFGHDYYLYVGVPSPCPQASLLASRLGLFVEEFATPYSRPE